MVMKTLVAYATVLALGFGAGYVMKTGPSREYSVIKHEQQNYIVDRSSKHEYPIFRVNNKPQVGDITYRLQGILDEQSAKKSQTDLTEKLKAARKPEVQNDSGN